MPVKAALAYYSHRLICRTDHMAFFADWLKLVVMTDKELEELGFSTTLGRF